MLLSQTRGDAPVQVISIGAVFYKLKETEIHFLIFSFYYERERQS